MRSQHTLLGNDYNLCFSFSSFFFFLRYFVIALFRIFCSAQLLLFPAMKRQSAIVSFGMVSHQSFNKVKRLNILSAALFNHEKYIAIFTSNSKFGNSCIETFFLKEILQ